MLNWNVKQTDKIICTKSMNDKTYLYFIKNIVSYCLCIHRSFFDLNKSSNTVTEEKATLLIIHKSFLKD